MPRLTLHPRVCLLHSVGAVAWPPKIGEPLPRAETAWYQWSKVEDWILSPDGHGSEWDAIFHVRLENWQLAWKVIAEVTAASTIKVVRERPPFGIACGVDVDLTINERSAPVTLSWHYLDEGSAPRLVTAYPRL